VAETLLAGTSLLANIAIVAGACLLVVRPFFGKPTPATKKAHAAPVSLYLGPVLLAGLGLLLGLFPGSFGEYFLVPAVGAVMGEPAEFSLYLWHGFTIELAMSVVTVAAGVGLYFGWDAMRKTVPARGFERWLGTGLDRGYDHTIDGILSFGKWQTRVLQNGYLRSYLSTILGVAVLLIAASYIRGGLFGWPVEAMGAIEPHEYVLSALIVGSAVGCIFFASRVAAIASLGIAGFGIALMYLSFGAPDLAKTQFLVETLTVILFMLVLLRLPDMKEAASQLGKARDAVIALSVGGMITLLMLAALRLPFDSNMANYYAENTYTLGEGRNIVNTILVDFRAIDTFGEIAVLLVAAFGIYALVRLGRDSDAAEAKPATPSKETA